LVDLSDLSVVATTSYDWRGIVRHASFAPDPATVVLGKFNGEVVACRPERSRLVAERMPFARHSGRVVGVETIPGKAVLVTVGAEGAVYFTSWPERTRVGQVTTGSALSSVHISPSGDFMALGHSQSAMSLWDLRVLDIPLLLARPLSGIVPGYLPAVQAALDSLPTSSSEGRRTLLYLQAALRHRFRYDIAIDEVRRIKPGEYDIALGEARH
jgi:hypothetical protein